MAHSYDNEQVAQSIAQMSREDVKRQLLDFRGRFELDFSESFLEELSVDRLRHILLAALFQQRRVN